MDLERRHRPEESKRRRTSRSAASLLTQVPHGQHSSQLTHTTFSNDKHSTTTSRPSTNSSSTIMGHTTTTTSASLSKKDSKSLAPPSRRVDSGDDRVTALSAVLTDPPPPPTSRQTNQSPPKANNRTTGNLSTFFLRDTGKTTQRRGHTNSNTMSSNGSQATASVHSGSRDHPYHTQSDTRSLLSTKTSSTTSSSRKKSRSRLEAYMEESKDKSNFLDDSYNFNSLSQFQLDRTESFISRTSTQAELECLCLASNTSMALSTTTLYTNNQEIGEPLMSSSNSTLNTNNVHPPQTTTTNPRTLLDTDHGESALHTTMNTTLTSSSSPSDDGTPTSPSSSKAVVPTHMMDYACDSGDLLSTTSSSPTPPFLFRLTTQSSVRRMMPERQSSSRSIGSLMSWGAATTNTNNNHPCGASIASIGGNSLFSYATGTSSSTYRRRRLRRASWGSSNRPDNPLAAALLRHQISTGSWDTKSFASRHVVDPPQPHEFLYATSPSKVTAFSPVTKTATTTPMMEPWVGQDPPGDVTMVQTPTPVVPSHNTPAFFPFRRASM